ncbi:MAG: DUF4288 domain-containing protein [Cyanobacteria bacterium J06623_7]
MATSDKSFYLAVILYQSSSGSQPPLYEECFTLIKANSLEKARQRAKDCATKAECSYLTEDGKTVSHSLIKIVDINNVLDDDLQDGGNIYARHFRNFAAYSAFEPLISGEDI